MDRLLERWNDTYFAGQLPPEVQNILDGLALSTQSDTVKSLIEGQFKAMKQTHFSGTDFTDDLARQMSIIPNLVPEAWVTGTPPPLTVPKRHTKIDHYITCNSWWQFPPTGKLLEIGCGFPPVTTIEIAEKLKDWQIMGIDPAIPYYIVYDERGDYASFNQAKEMIFFQGQDDRFGTLLQDPEGTKHYFSQLFQVLLSEASGPTATELTSTKSPGARLVTQPIAAYENTNLSFQAAGIGEIDVQNLDLVRCFNVLLYFNRLFRNEAMIWFTKILREGGLLLCGVNSHLSTQCRYSVYQKVGESLLAKEFAFSLDNIRTLGFASWWTFHNDELEYTLQAQVIAQIRANISYRRDFDARLDGLLADFKLYRRGTDGYLVSWEPGALKNKNQLIPQIIAQLDQEGYVEGAINVLKQAGYDAWRNCAGHISVDPNQF